MADSGNIFQTIPAQARDELFETLASTGGVTIERIVSTGQSTPPGEWYDQEQHEFILLLSGAAALRFETEAEDREIAVGDWLWIPARCRHRVVRTSADPVTFWLAIFVPLGTDDEPRE